MSEMHAAKLQTYGYRFSDTANKPFCQLFAVGHQRVTNTDYVWNGLTRIDGPLYLFQYTVGGFGHLKLGNDVHRIEEGQAFLVDIPSAHEYYFPPTSKEWEFFFILMRPDQIEWHWQEIVKQLGPTPRIPPDSSVIALLQQIYHACGKQHVTDGYRASAVVHQFVTELYRFSATFLKEPTMWQPSVQQAVRVMEQEYNRLQSLEDIAAAAGLSKYHFTRSFKKATGYSPVEYLSKIRMEKALVLLRTTDATVEEIAQQVGYSSGSYFIKVFRQWIGFSPGEFRAGRDLTFVNRLELN